MTASRKKVMFSLSEALVEDITKFAKEFNTSKSSLVSEALEYYLDYMDLKIAKKRAESKEEVVSLAQMKEMLR